MIQGEGASAQSLGSVSAAELEGGGKNDGGNVEMVQVSNAPNGQANGALGEGADRGEFFTGHPQEGGKVNISTYEDFKKRRVIWVKKSLKDPTAALSYSLSVSILHLAMVLGLIFVKRPDIAATSSMHQTC